MIPGKKGEEKKWVRSGGQVRGLIKDVSGETEGWRKKREKERERLKEKMTVR